MTLRRDAHLALAELFQGEAEVRRLLDPLGVDLARLPTLSGGTPQEFWYATCTKVDNGAFPVTLTGLLEAAALEYPNHPQLHRLLTGAAEPEGGELPDPATVLFLISAPHGPPPLQQSEEFRNSQEAAAVGRGRHLDMRIRVAARNRDVIPALLAEEPHIVHFAGHGSPNGFLLMEGDDGDVAPVRAAWLAEALTSYGGIHALVLMTCHLGRELNRFDQSTRAAIGCDAPLPDPATLAFSRDFYGALSHGRSVPEAFAMGRAAIRMAAGGAPDLRLRLGGRLLGERSGA